MSENANIAAQNFVLDAIYGDQVSVVSVGSGETKKIRFARMCTDVQKKISLYVKNENLRRMK